MTKTQAQRKGKRSSGCGRERQTDREAGTQTGKDELGWRLQSEL